MQYQMSRLVVTCCAGNFVLLAGAGNLALAAGKGMGKPCFRIIQTHFSQNRANVGDIAAKEEVKGLGSAALSRELTDAACWPWRLAPYACQAGQHRPCQRLTSRQLVGLGSRRSAVGSVVQHPGAACGGGERPAYQRAVGVGCLSGELSTRCRSSVRNQALLDTVVTSWRAPDICSCAQAMHVGLRYKALSLLQLPSLNQKRASALVCAHAAGQPLPGG